MVINKRFEKMHFFQGNLNVHLKRKTIYESCLCIFLLLPFTFGNYYNSLYEVSCTCTEDTHCGVHMILTNCSK